MPMTLDTVAALVVIDLQKGIVGMPTVHPAADIVARSAALAGAFRAAGLPVVLVNVTGGAPGRTAVAWPAGSRPEDWTELVPELHAQAGDILVTKQRWGAFTGTILDGELRKRGATQIVLAGIATSFGVESTARFAHELGYNVVLITDAMTDRDPDAHQRALEKIFPRLGELATTDELLAALQRRETPRSSLHGNA